MPLTDVRLKTLKPEAKTYKKADAEGLFIQVEPNGSKLWRFRYRFALKQKLLALGAYPTVSLLDARRARDDAKRLLAKGIDPAEEKKKARQPAPPPAPVTGPTFETVAREWIALKHWTPRYSKQMHDRLDQNLISQLGPTPVADVTPKQVIDCIRVMEDRGALVLAREQLGVLRNIFQYAIVHGHAEKDPTLGVNKVLRDPKPVKHHTALKKADLPTFFTRLNTVSAEEITKLALRFTMHTMVRTNETFGMVPEEIEGTLWRIPAARMKMRKEHLVPLSRQALNIVQRAREFNPKGRLFPMSNNAMLYMTYRMGFFSRATVHGFRRTASTILNEEGFNRDWIEMQLAHSDNTVRGIYNSAEWLADRAKMLQWWSDFLDAQAKVKRDNWADLLS